MADQNSNPRLSDHLCECGCGGFTNRLMLGIRADGRIRFGAPQRYIFRHRSIVPVSAEIRAKISAARLGRRLVATVKHYREAPFYRLDPISRRRTEHQARAERALGHPLPPHACVHHADGSKNEDAPLVICENRAYHNLLHARMRIKSRGGDPNRQRWCGTCKQLRLISEMGSQYCRECNRKKTAIFHARHHVLSDHLCECGCGEFTYWNGGGQWVNRFLEGHRSRLATKRAGAKKCRSFEA